jgi:hypothetical protein
MGGTASAVVDAENASGQWLTESAVNDHIFVCERPTGEVCDESSTSSKHVR